MTLEEARKNIGRYVTYIPFKGCSKDQLELGVITSVNEKDMYL